MNESTYVSSNLNKMNLRQGHIAATKTVMVGFKKLEVTNKGIDQPEDVADLSNFPGCMHHVF